MARSKRDALVLTTDDLFDRTMDFGGSPVDEGDHEPELPAANRYERMSLAEVSRLAGETADLNHDLGGEPPRPFESLSEQGVARRDEAQGVRAYRLGDDGLVSCHPAGAQPPASVDRFGMYSSWGGMNIQRQQRG